jgi:carbamoylphosphate synthase small subunit
MALRPDGVFLSNGPGDPEPCDYAIDLARKVMDAREAVVWNLPWASDFGIGQRRQD